MQGFTSTGWKAFAMSQKWLQRLRCFSDRSNRSADAAGLLVCIAVLCCGTHSAIAQDPAITSVMPWAAKPGETVDIKLRGANLAGVTQLWTSFACEAVMPTDVAGNGTNAGEVLYRIKLPPEAGVGVCGIRVATPKGISNLKLIAIDDLPSVAQVKPNAVATSAQVLTLPCAVDGNVDSLSRDYYKFQATAGQRISFEVLARRLGSPLDSMLRILDLKGRELAYSDDVPGIGSDSQLSYTFSEAGEYLLELRDIRFQGGATFQYRLRIGDFACVTVPYPMGIKKGAPANVGFAGSSGQDAQPFAVNLPADATVHWLNVGAKPAGAKSSGFAVLSVGANDELVEVEPNNELAQATRVTLGANINGRFDQSNDVDRFVFTAKMGQHFTFSGITRSQGSPSDLYMRLLKADGAEVAMAEDSGPNEGIIDYTFPADGDYTLAVEDLHRRGGPEFAYRIAVTQFEEKFALAAASDTMNIPAGGVGSVLVTATRGKFTGPIVLSLADAPEGIAATPVIIGPGRVSAVLTVSCAANAATGKVNIARIVGTSTLGTTEYTAVATLSDAQKVAFSGLPFPPPSLGEAFAIGVNPAPLFTLKTDPPEVVFGKNLTATVKVVATRSAGFVDEIALALLPAQDALPAGITAALKPIAKDTNEVAIVLTANPQAPLGTFTGVFQGTGKLMTTTTVQPIPALKLTLQAPYVLKPDFAGGTITKGQTLKIKVVAERNPAYAGPITITFQNLPKGVTAPAAMIAEAQNEVEIVLTAAADAAVGAVPNVIVQGEGVVGAVKLPEAAPAASLTVQ